MMIYGSFCGITFMMGFKFVSLDRLEHFVGDVMI